MDSGILDEQVNDWVDKTLSQMPVAHTYNPSYSGVRDQEDLGSKPVQANSL
jgi:hypothetical protein